MNQAVTLTVHSCHILSVTNIFTNDYFRETLVFVQVLQKLSKIYGFNKVRDLILQEIQLSDLKIDIPVLNTYI